MKFVKSRFKLTKKRINILKSMEGKTIIHAMFVTEYLRQRVDWSFIISHHQEVPRKYKCDFCGNFFTQAGSMKKHITTFHEDQSNYNCKTCGQSFRQLENLNTHNKRMHEGEGQQKHDLAVIRWAQTLAGPSP